MAHTDTPLTADEVRDIDEVRDMLARTDSAVERRVLRALLTYLTN